MYLKKIIKIILLYIPLGYIALSLLLVLTLKWVPVYLTPLMIVRGVQNIEAKDYHIRKTWKPYDEISINMTKAVVAAEDQKFFQHNGFDIDEIFKMREEHLKKGKSVRGCSTISQQTAKNCFTFCTRTWARKALEAYYTLLIELIWGKERIMEVYLNIAEMGPGLFGAEAACQKYYGHPAARMSVTEAATLACCLPNPLKRTPQWVSRYRCKHRADIIRYMSY